MAHICFDMLISGSFSFNNFTTQRAETRAGTKLILNSDL